MITEDLKYFEFKKFPHDFIVEEKLWNVPSWKGHVFYVFFEKKNKNTFDILKYLSKELNLKRKHFWIAWLKDKFWITRQWISIYKRTLNSRGWAKKFLDILSKKVKILKYTWWDELLKVWDNKWNLFFLRLRRKDIGKGISKNYNQKISEDFFKKIVEQCLKEIKENWFPNYFGIQRFWKKFSNPKIWKKLILWQKFLNDPLEAQFKVQAYASWLFNKYIDLRLSEWLFDKFVKWDILVDILSNKHPIFRLYLSDTKFEKEKFIVSWPVWGYNLVVSWDFKIKDWMIVKFTELTPALELELEILKQEWLTVNVLANFKKFKVFGIRRPIKVIPSDLRYKWDKNDLLLMFELPSWSYASVLVSWLDKLIDEKLTQNLW